MPTKTIKLADAPPDIFAAKLLGVQCHEGQAKWLRSADARVRIACCGRRWGKSWAEAVDLIWFACRYPKTTQMLVAPTHDQTTIIFNDVEHKLRESPIAGALERIVHAPFQELRLNNGSVIMARSSGTDGKNIRGNTADRLIFDEAAFIPELAYQAITPLLLTSSHSRLVFISTPFGKNRFWEYFNRAQMGAEGYKAFQFPSSSNPFIDRDYLEQERRDMTALQYSVEYEAQFVDDQSSVFPYALIQSCLVDETDTEPLPDHKYVIGWDPAKWSDRSGVVVLDVTSSPWLMIQCRDISGQDYIEHQWPVIKRFSDTYHNAPILMDSTSNEPLLEYARKHGSGRVEGFQFTNPSKEELINNLVVAMQDKRLKFWPQRDLVTELTYYRYELTAAGNVKLGADEKHHDDLVTALALAVQKAGRKRDYLPRFISTERPVTVGPEIRMVG